MKIDSLDGLERAFAEWRSRKKHAREAVPAELIARAQRATKKHGVKAVVRVLPFQQATVPASVADRPSTGRARHRGTGAVCPEVEE